MSQNGSPLADTRNMYIIHMVFRREFGLLPGLVRSVAQRDEDYAERVHGTRTPPRVKEVGIGTPYVGLGAGARR